MRAAAHTPDDSSAVTTKLILNILGFIYNSTSIYFITETVRKGGFRFIPIQSRSSGTYCRGGVCYSAADGTPSALRAPPQRGTPPASIGKYVVNKRSTSHICRRDEHCSSASHQRHSHSDPLPLLPRPSSREAYASSIVGEGLVTQPQTAPLCPPDTSPAGRLLPKASVNMSLTSEAHPPFAVGTSNAHPQDRKSVV